MNKNTITSAGLAVAAALWVPFSACAATPAAGSLTTAGTSDLTVRGEIITIDMKKRNIEVNVTEGSGEGKKKIIFVHGDTKIEKENKINQYLKDLKEGDEASITYKEVKELDSKTKKWVPQLKAVKITVLSSKEGSSTNAPPNAAKLK